MTGKPVRSLCANRPKGRQHDIPPRRSIGRGTLLLVFRAQCRFPRPRWSCSCPLLPFPLLLCRYTDILRGDRRPDLPAGGQQAYHDEACQCCRDHSRARPWEREGCKSAPRRILGGHAKAFRRALIRFCTRWRAVPPIWDFRSIAPSTVSTFNASFSNCGAKECSSSRERVRSSFRS